MPKKSGNGHSAPAALIPTIDNEEKIAQELAKIAAEDAKDENTKMTDAAGGVTMDVKLGVLQRIITAVADDEGYRQILLLGAFDNKQEALLASDAISERKRYGVSITPILDRIIAQCAVNSDRVERVLRALSEYSMKFNYNKQGKGGKKEDVRGVGV